MKLRIVSVFFCLGFAFSSLCTVTGAMGKDPASPSSRPCHFQSTNDVRTSVQRCWISAKGKLNTAVLQYSGCDSSPSDSRTITSRLKSIATTAALAGMVAFASRAIVSRWVAIKAGDEVSYTFRC